ncbi:MAG: sigma-54-dependent Fis family transcriptional regulator [Deltaproteobacteria bacterium]|nr:sigma-54-dependent Fis family transcriptional regulator [Deltaproteobacteria bacterium]
MKERKILIIEDDALIRESLSDVLVNAGYKISVVSCGEDGVSAIRERPFDIVLTDLQLPGISGLDVLRSVKNVSPHSACIILTGYASIETAVEAMRAGAFTYLKKPFVNAELLVILEKAYELVSLKSENVNLKKEMRQTCTGAILGTSPDMQKVRELIEKVADTDTTVLILGESGTGKELVARALHYGSSRSGKPFVPINCGAIPEDLLESELFGHEKGAFTGAVATKIGRFEAADHGTIFLDEIGDMSPGLQVKLLRVLQEKQLERVGGITHIKIDARVVAATNQDLELAVEEKRFRKDLYYRLNVIPVSLPSLRKRKEDVPVLAKEFLANIAEKKKKKIRGITGEALDMLGAYDWPGNVRELENFMERIIVLKDDDSVITTRDLPEKIRAASAPARPQAAAGLPPDGIDFNSSVADYERELIVTALGRANGVKKKAAEYLRLNRTTLIEKMKRMDILDTDRAESAADSKGSNR